MGKLKREACAGIHSGSVGRWRRRRRSSCLFLFWFRLGLVSIVFWLFGSVYVSGFILFSFVLGRFGLVWFWYFTVFASLRFALPYLTQYHLRSSPCYVHMQAARVGVRQPCPSSNSVIHPHFHTIRHINWYASTENIGGNRLCIVFSCFSGGVRIIMILYFVTTGLDFGEISLCSGK